MICREFEIVSRQEPIPGVFDYKIHCPELVAEASPGQFVHIRCGERSLRRPISICALDRGTGELRLVFEVRGEGTRELSHLAAGDRMDILGPLGHGFELLDPGARAVVVGGGIGTPPLLEGARHYGERCQAILGFRSVKNVILDQDFASACGTVVCTDDGSWGVRGTVLPALEAALQGFCPQIVYACGPKPMLKGIQELCARYPVRCQLSLEERMGCGVGACLVCACKTRAEDGQENYAHVCKDGPVFEAQSVVFE